jgi:methyl-accepting chemotaxis protein
MCERHSVTKVKSARTGGRKRFKLQTQLFVAIGSLAALPAVLLGIAQARIAAVHAAELADRETLLTGTSLARELGGLLEAEANIVRTAAGEVGAAGRLDVDVDGERAKDYFRLFPELYGVMILDMQGWSVGGAVHEAGREPRAAAGSFFGDRKWVKDIAQGAAFSGQLVASRMLSRPAVAFAAAVVDRSGNRLGLVSNGIYLEAVQQALERVTEAAPGLTSVVLDEDSRVVGVAGDERVSPLKSLRDVRLYDPLAGAVERRFGYSTTGELRRGTAALIQTRVVKWRVVTTWPDRVVRERALKALGTMAGFALGALAVGLVAAVLLARTIARPIARLSRLVESIGEGDLRVRPEPLKAWYPRELQELNASVEGMLGRLNPLAKQLGRAVSSIADVTQLLARAVGQMLGDSNEQREGVTKSSAAIVQMNDSMDKVGDGVQSASRTASEVMSSIMSVDEQIVRIVDSVRRLSATVDGASSEGAAAERHVDVVVQSTVLLSDTVERTAGSLQLLTESIKQVGVAAEHEEALARDALSAAVVGCDAVDRIAGAMSQIQERFDAVGTTVLRLSDRSDAIGEVVRVIDEVTRATRLLSINAAIIASQAGEQGSGFSVVADGVRALASETAASTSRITDLITSVQVDIQQAVDAVASGQKAVGAGEQLSKEAGQRLRAIIDSAGQAEMTVREIATASRDQVSRVDLLTVAVSEVHNATKRISSIASSQRQVQQKVAQALDEVRSVCADVRTATIAQRKDSRTITTAVQAMTGRLQTIAHASEVQSQERNRIEKALSVFEGAAQGNVEHARQLGDVMSRLADRLEQLQDQLSTFRVA